MALKSMKFLAIACFPCRLFLSQLNGFFGGQPPASWGTRIMPSKLMFQPRCRSTVLWAQCLVLKSYM